MISFKRVTSQNELQQIKALQEANHLSQLSSTAQGLSEGFVTALYTLDFLEKMHESEPSVIAVEQDRVIGYALATTRETAVQHPLLAALFDQIDTLAYQETLLSEVNYLVVGQLCIAGGYRGRGLAPSLYHHYRQLLCKKYSYCLTDIDLRNQPSLRAHLKAGFTEIDRFSYGQADWSIVLWDWREDT
jgi:hypothetical protein